MIDAADFIAIIPELILFFGTCVIALLDLQVKSAQRTLTYSLTLLSLAVVAVLEVQYATNAISYTVFHNMVTVDAMGSWLKCAATIAVMATLVYGRPYAAGRDMLRGGEVFTLSLFSLLGMFVMISGNNLLVIYMGLELLTLASYALVALRRDHIPAIEAAMKYFVLGAMASGFLLYGMSMLYGSTGTLTLNEISKVISSRSLGFNPLMLGLVFIVAGLAFKLGVVPFHMWIPDVYQGSPTVATLMIGGAPKLAAFAITLRLLVEALFPLAMQWQEMLMVLALGSLLIGNLAAIMQTNIKRMLAFSTIAQMGFVLLALLSGVTDHRLAPSANNAYSAAMFYVISYVLTTMAVFGVILLLSREGFESEEISDFAGLNQRNPFYAAVMSICLLSLAGIPPMIGFYTKLSVLQALMASGDFWHIQLAIYAVVMSLIAAFYYLRVLKVMYFDSAIVSGTETAIVAGFHARFVLCVNGLLVLVLGLWPGKLMQLCEQSIAQLLRGL